MWMFCPMNISHVEQDEILQQICPSKMTTIQKIPCLWCSMLSTHNAKAMFVLSVT